MTSNEGIIRNLYEVAEKEPKRFGSLLTENGSGGTSLPAYIITATKSLVRPISIRLHFRTCTANSTTSTSTATPPSFALTLHGTHLGDLPTALGTIPATGKAFHAPSCDVFRLEDGKVSAFDCYYAGTILLGQIGVLGNLEASIRK